MKIAYRGSMPAPKHEHGDTLEVGGISMTIESRTWTGSTWCYTGMTSDGRALMHHYE